MGLREVYDTVSPGYVGRCTAPLLVDKVAVKAVCNESSDLVAMLNEVQLEGCSPVDLRPPALLSQLEQMNNMIYDKVALWRSASSLPLSRPLALSSLPSLSLPSQQQQVGNNSIFTSFQPPRADEMILPNDGIGDPALLICGPPPSSLSWSR